VVHHERQEGRAAAGRGEDSSGQHGRRRWEPTASGAQVGGDSGSAVFFFWFFFRIYDSLDPRCIISDVFLLEFVMYLFFLENL
jgi:hypothetical protein